MCVLPIQISNLCRNFQCAVKIIDYRRGGILCQKFIIIVRDFDKLSTKIIKLNTKY